MQKRSVFISEGCQGIYFRHGHPVGDQDIPAGWYDDLGFGMFAVNLSNVPKKKPTAYLRDGQPGGAGRGDRKPRGELQ